MNPEELLNKIENLDDRINAFNISLTAINKKIGELDDKSSGFLNLVREDKKEIATLKTTIFGVNQTEISIAQIRSDFTRKLDDLENQRKQEDQIQNNLIKGDSRSNRQMIEKFRTDLSKEYENKIDQFKKENSRLINRFKEIEKEVKENIIASEARGDGMNLITQDVKRAVKLVENIQAEVGVSIEKQNELGSKVEIISKNVRNDAVRLNEVIANETELKKVQLDFIEVQSVQQNDRNRIWGEWEKQFEEFSKQVYGLLPDLQNQQFNLKHSQNDFEEMTAQFERRINELTEMYRLMDDKLRNEWTTFKADSEKRWSNISMVIEDKQGGYTSRLESLKDRMALVEDNTHELQEVLLMLSSEVQKSMQGFMKMVNGWMDTFGQIKSPK